MKALMTAALMTAALATPAAAFDPASMTEAERAAFGEAVRDATEAALRDAAGSQAVSPGRTPWAGAAPARSTASGSPCNARSCRG